LNSKGGCRVGIDFRRARQSFQLGEQLPLLELDHSGDGTLRRLNREFRHAESIQSAST
jgi:hypothetical protein